MRLRKVNGEVTKGKQIVYKTTLNNIENKSNNILLLVLNIFCIFALDLM